MDISSHWSLSTLSQCNVDKWSPIASIFLPLQSEPRVPISQWLFIGWYPGPVLFSAIWGSFCGFSCVYSHSHLLCCPIHAAKKCLHCTKFFPQAINSKNMANILSDVRYYSAAIFVKPPTSISPSLSHFSSLSLSFAVSCYWTYRRHPSLWQQFMQLILYFRITQDAGFRLGQCFEEKLMQKLNYHLVYFRVSVHEFLGRKKKRYDRHQERGLGGVYMGGGGGNLTH